MFTNTGMGLLPLSFTEIDAWSRLSGAGVTTGEAQIVRAMSEAFLEGRATERAPYMPLECRLALTTAAILNEAP